MTKTMLLVTAAVAILTACGGDDDSATTLRKPTTSTRTLSSAFANTCASCHGAKGQGQGEFPALPGGRSESGYIALVRAGSGTMPAFSASQISDADLKADYAILSE